MHYETKEKAGKERSSQILEIFECKAEKFQLNLIDGINPRKAFNQKCNMI